MAETVFFSDLPSAGAFQPGDILIGIRDNGDGTFKNYQYNFAQVVTAVLNNSRAVIISSENGKDLIDDWLLDHEPEILITDRSAYLKDEDFTQTGGIITGITIGFSKGQKIIAMI